MISPARHGFEHYLGGSPRQPSARRRAGAEYCVFSDDMSAELLGFPDGAVMPQPVRRKTLAISLQDWVREALAGDRDQRPQLVLDAACSCAIVANGSRANEKRITQCASGESTINSDDADK